MLSLEPVSASPGDSLRVPNCTAEELEKICENTNLKFLAIGYFYSDTLPACIGNLTQLEELDICWDGYRLPIRKATVLPAIGKLTKLKSLTFSGGYLPIELPSELGNLTSLERLRIYNLKFDHLPESIGQLINVKDAMLCGDLKTLPESIVNWSQITSLYLAGNNFNDVPNAIYSLVSLESISLEQCEINQLSDSIGLLVNLKKLDFSGNYEVDDLPENICSLKSLESLDIANTMIHKLPACLSELTSLKEIKMCDLLVENCDAMNTYLHGAIQWDHSCHGLRSELVDYIELFGDYTTWMEYEKDSLELRIVYSYNIPGWIDEEFTRMVEIKVARGHTFEMGRVYPLSFSCFDTKATSFSIWDWGEFRYKPFEGYIVFKEIERRKIQAYIQFYFIEDGEKVEVLHDTFLFKKNRKL
jgi:hypothetical protein